MVQILASLDPLPGLASSVASWREPDLRKSEDSLI
jgi:hypothetical protein